MEKSRFATAFTFQYSKRPGTPAADLPDQLPKAVVQERFERLTALQDRIAAEENARQLGRRVEVMVTAQSGRKAEETHRLSGRAQDQRLVHFSVPAGAGRPAPRRPRDRDHHGGRRLPPVADPASAADYSLRRSRAGDAWDRSQADSCGAPAPAVGPSGRQPVQSRQPGPSSLGMPAPARSGAAVSRRHGRPQSRAGADSAGADAPPVIAVVGPTGSGKSDLAVALALELDGEVINADSMQFYRGMDIGTAKITEAERRGVPHHLLDILDVTRGSQRLRLPAAGPRR